MHRLFFYPYFREEDVNPSSCYYSLKKGSLRNHQIYEQKFFKKSTIFPWFIQTFPISLYHK